MNRVLVTGANGCIGNVLVQFLVNSGYEVTALSLDSLDTSKISDLNGINIVFGNICNLEAMRDLFAKWHFDALVHLAAIVHQPRANKEGYMNVNYEATVNLFELSKSHGVKQFIFISTVAIYGDEVDKAVDDEAAPNPQNPYAISKFKAEEYIINNHHQVIQYTIIRPSTVYGRHDKGNINRLFSMAKRGIVPIIGNGKNLKSFIYVENLVEGILKTILNEKAYNQDFIMSDERPYSLNELLVSMEQVIGKRIIVFHLPTSVTFFLLRFFNSLCKIFANKEVFDLSSIKKLVTNNVFDISKTRKLLNFEPQYTFLEGLKKAYIELKPAPATDDKTHF